MLLFQKGRIDEAIAHYQKAMTLHPDHFLARYSLGHALLEKGELDSAIQVCRSALCSALWMQIVTPRWLSLWRKKAILRKQSSITRKRWSLHRARFPR